MLIKRPTFRISAILLALLGTLVIFAPNAVAGNAYSATKNIGSVNGYTYTNEAIVSTGDPYQDPSGITAIHANVNVPTGWVGVKARLFISDTMCAVTTILYSDQPLSGMSRGITQGCGYGNYYSQGYSYEYTGSGYQRNATFKTPYQTWSS